MGEIGLDCGTDFEVWLFREHLRLAKAHDLPVILHTPIRMAPQGPTITPRVFEIIREEGFPVERCVFDHACEETMDFRMTTGGMVGLSICWDKMPPEAAARHRPRAPRVARPAASSTRGSAGRATTTSWCLALMLAMRLMGSGQRHDRPGLLPDAHGLLRAPDRVRRRRASVRCVRPRTGIAPRARRSSAGPRRSWPT